MEYEANLFAAQIALPDDEILEYIHNGYDVEQTAQAMCSDVNLVALKVEDLNRRGYAFREQECDWRFLR
jgi:Zn-dependent peptidase ImmA (M78 family)